MQRRLTFVDKLISNADQALRTLVPSAANSIAPSPAATKDHTELSAQEQKHITGLMLSLIHISEPTRPY